ncbi:MAG TPA: glycosyltransferase family 39 protein [Sphingomicrobium sp.]
MIAERRKRTIAIALILLVALALRFNNIAFGLPSLWDPDEPTFMLIPLNMLTDRTFDPGWFGHPGSTTIYLIGLIEGAAAGFGLAIGRYPDIASFARAAFEDPSLLLIPARVVMALIGVGTVWLTYFVGRRLHGTTTGLVAALLLAINALHIAWSQVVRTDINASLFMLTALLFSIRAYEQGRLKDYVLAGAFAGLATVTKWPAITVFVAVVGAAAGRGLDRRELAKLGASAAALVAAMFLASPFVFIDWRTVLSNLNGEAKPTHLAHTGAGFLSNLRFYLIFQIRSAMGWIGLTAVLAGAWLLANESRAARWTLIPAAGAFLALICAQHLIWSRWMLPVLPTMCIFAGAAAEAFRRAISRRMPRLNPSLLVALVTATLIVPSLMRAVDQANERANDTRGQAARWAMEHIPPGSTVVLEHLELSLRHQPWKILFPVGRAGCIDGVRALSGGIRYQRFEQLRRGSPIVDLGNVPADRVRSCHADFAILTYYDLYRADGSNFAKEIQTYKSILAGGRTVALFAPRPGSAGGPLVRIVALPQH